MNHSTASAQETLSQQKHHASNTRLSGRWLIVARVVWIILVLFLLGAFIASLPTSFATLYQSCTRSWCTYSGLLTASEIQALPQYGLSLDTYAWSWIVINGGTALVWFVVGGILFWRKSDDWMALLVALMLISSGANATNNLLYSSSIWRIPENGVQLIVGLTILFTLALFPNGRFVPRWAVWITLINPVYIAIYLLFLRPLHIPGWVLFNNPLNAVAWFGCWIILTLAQLYRYFRMSDPIERQQTKWVAFSFFIVVTVGFIVTAWSVPSLLPIQHNGLLYILISNSFSLIDLLIPISLGLAMLRSRLWDIDLLINRTLIYGTLTVILALVYFGLIFGLQSLFQGLFKQNNAVAIVISTLVIAALFQPLRHRIQRFIDRRFYRSKYDAAKTLEAFSETLRNEVDLNQLREQLLNVVQETMQPAHVSLWLHSPDRHTEEPLRLEKPNRMEEGF